MQLSTVNRNNYQEILSFESEKDQYEKQLANRGEEVERLKKERDDDRKRESKNASLFKELKESTDWAVLIFRDEIKKCHTVEAA